MFRGRFVRRWGLLVLVMCCVVYTAVYMTTFYTYDVGVNLDKPRRNNPPPFPWELPDPVKNPGPVKGDDDDGHFVANRNIREHESQQKLSEHSSMSNKTENGPRIQEPRANETKLDERFDNDDDFMAARRKVNHLRRELVRQKCDSIPDLSRGPITDNTYRHIYVNDQHKLLYCFVPKVACSNWKRVMMVLSGNTKKISEMSSNEVHFTNGMKRLAGFSQTERKHKLATYKKFAYARNPFVRVLSAFNNKYGDVIQYRKETYFQGFAKTIMKRFRPHATQRELKTGENITWTEFVKFLTQPQRPFFDDHWEEIYKICAPCKINYDYLGHLETVSEDARFMLTDLGLDSLVQFPSRGNSHPTNSTSEFERAFKSLPQENLIRLWNIYSKDFSLFDYEKPDFVP
ncbi:carbohydrate sulfotransferase 11-like [Diadema antillarum]|uniref:carbohydrate sulfotransferase 11-like n=1 Tax=Diadema antillarum TaxID=105358 RepID=UPI003A8BC768